LHYDNGEKKYEMQQTIQPGHQMWVNLSQLVRQRIPDRTGNALPVDVSSDLLQQQSVPVRDGYALRDDSPANRRI